MSVSIRFTSFAARQLLAANQLYSLGQVIEACSGPPFCQSRSSTTYKIDLQSVHGTVGVYVKRYSADGCFPTDYARRESRNLQRLRHHSHDIVPEVLAIGRQRKFSKLVAGYILTQAIPDSVTLEQFANQFSIVDDSGEQIRQQLENQTLILCKQMHRMSFFHGDLQWRNILVRTQFNDEGHQRINLYVIDCPRGGFIVNPLAIRHAIAKDLASMDKKAHRYLSRTQRLRWFLNYRNHAHVMTSDKRLLRSIQRIKRQRAIRWLRPPLHGQSMHFADGYRPKFADDNFDSYEKFLDFPNPVPMSVHVDRQVDRIEWRGEKYYIKQVAKMAVQDVIAALLHRQRPLSGAAAEWHTLQQLRFERIAAATPIAAGAECQLGFPTRSFLLTRALPVRISLADWLSTGKPYLKSRLRRECLQNAAQLVGRLHEARFSWPDLVPKHLLLGNDDAWYLTDVERMRQGRLGFETKNLRKFFIACVLSGATARDLIALWRGYRGYQSVEPESWKRRRKLLLWDRLWMFPAWRLAKALAHDGQARANRLRPRNWKCDRQGGCMINTRYQQLLNQHGLGTLEEVLDYGDGQHLEKPGLNGRWRQRLRLKDIDGHPHVLYLKQYDVPSAGQLFRSILAHRRIRATAEYDWRPAFALSRLGIATPEPVAHGCQHGRWPGKSFVITAALERADALERWLPENHQGVDFAARKRLIERVAGVVRALHGGGYCHRDLYLSHIFVRPTENDFEIFLIDLQRVFTPIWRKRRWFVKDLSALYYGCSTDIVNRTDQVRFLHHYFGVRRLKTLHRGWIHAIIRKSTGMKRRTRRRETQ